MYSVTMEFSTQGDLSEKGATVCPTMGGQVSGRKHRREFGGLRKQRP